MSVTRPAWWSQSILLLLLVVISCDQAGDRQRVIAEAVEAKNGGAFQKAAELYHQAERLGPLDAEQRFLRRSG
jgi:hypothetical protein